LLAQEKYMRRCIELAQLGAGSVSPNPMVGAVIVYNDYIIGEGFHQHYGGPHAEVNAIQHVLARYPNAGELLRESIIYVSLEPCAHYGKTPPCADLIIKHQIPKVVIGSADPFEQVNGKGVQKLKDAGIEVIQHLLKDECDFMNRRFFTRIKKQRPYIILKWAQTSNQFFAPENHTQKWISSYPAKILTHQWRAEEDAVLVGTATALIDNPQLTTREVSGRNPKRIVIDKNLDLPSHLHVFDQQQETIVFNSLKTDVAGKIKYLELEDFSLLPQLICYQLYLMDIQSMIIEGGANTLKQFIDANLWDEARIFTSPDRWSGGVKSPDIYGTTLSTRNVGRDRLEIISAI
jgi:diaminohydroxyphosphoribosylaminopyrimidine deaminase / 5-amino-6-(5-phosphoribosylamino)uracil reductase